MLLFVFFFTDLQKIGFFLVGYPTSNSEFQMIVKK